MPRKGSTKPEKAKFLSREQVSAILAGPRKAKAERDYVLLAITYFLGRRVGEVVRLQRRHFDNLEMGECCIPILKKARLHACSARCKSPCPNAGKRTWPKKYREDPLTGYPLVPVMILPDAVPVVRRAIALADEHGWLFGGRAMSHLSTRQAERIFARWRDEAGVNEAVTIHSFRHTAISRVVEAAGVAAGRDFAAHSNIMSTSVYVHRTPENESKAAGSLRVP